MPETAQRTLEAILDWRDADDLKRPNGAEAPDYQAAGSKYVPTNSPFESVGELQRVLGVTPALMARIAPHAHRLFAAAGHQPDDGRAATSCSRCRASRRSRSTPSSPRATRRSRTICRYRRSRRRRASRRAASPVWRIHVVARTPDGVTFARDAVLRPLIDPRRPLVTLLWQEGAPDPTSDPTATGKSAQENGTGKP